MQLASFRVPTEDWEQDADPLVPVNGEGVGDIDMPDPEDTVRLLPEIPAPMITLPLLVPRNPIVAMTGAVVKAGAPLVPLILPSTLYGPAVAGTPESCKTQTVALVTHRRKSPEAGTVDPGLIVQLAVMEAPAPRVHTKPEASVMPMDADTPDPTPTLTPPGVETSPDELRVAVAFGLNTCAES
jgi:hypothetical protein